MDVRSTAHETEHEKRRLALVADYAFLIGAGNDTFREICELARALFGVSFSYVNLLGKDRGYYLVKGAAGQVDFDRHNSFTERVFQETDITIVPDALADEKYKDLPVKSFHKTRFFGAFPLMVAPGMSLGVLSILDPEPREFCETDRAHFRRMGALVVNELNRQKGLVDLKSRNDRLRDEIEERQAIAFKLAAANAALIDTQSAIRNLLDNADQGFLTIASDLVVHAQCSAACETILGLTPAGKPIVDLLCRAAPQDAKTALHTTLESVFRDSSDFIRDLKLGLLPSTFALDGRSLKVGYKFLADSGRLMLILTDVSETVLLTEAVERERQRLEMIVLAVTEGKAFAALVSDYRKFLVDEMPALLARIETVLASGELYRHIHTYKGLLAQFSFHRSPARLHDLETLLSSETAWTAVTARQAFKIETLLAELERDLESVSEVLGDDFMPSDGHTALSQRQLQSMEQIAKQVLTSQEGRTASPPLRQMLRTLAGLDGLNVKSALVLHGLGASALAARLDKQLAPILVEGSDVSLPIERHGAFFRSLVHVFRNAVDHGIETPDERVFAGKAAEGAIRCDISHRNGRLEILIADDGRGVDRALLEDKLITAGMDAAQARKLSLEDLVFRDGLSSRDTASAISGRGVGLAAVRSELETIGGAVTVETQPGAGTRFRFRLAIGSETPADAALEMSIP